VCRLCNKSSTATEAVVSADYRPLVVPHGRPAKHTVGMTGEVTLQGRVLPIGGLKQKV
jgi:ATP-dependent Lon protease